ILLDEWRLLHPQTHLVAIEPSSFLARECRAKGIEVIEDMVENVTETCGYANLVVCFEVLEHVHDPLVFLRTLARLVVPGGHVFVSTLGVDGFDIQILWEKSNSIFPPHHINFPSVSGLWHLFSRAGLVDVEITTPGVLDVDIVRNAARRDPHLLHGQRFVEKIIADDALAGSMQRFLIENKMSSHTWIIGRKPG
ncbi:MAG: class I SAM-dependent methyltransferase, partial [Magnetococcus sp. THC-1_WYH]